MKQSKLIALFLIVTIFLTVMVPCVGAQTVPVFSVQSVSAFAGDIVEVNINVKDNPGILGAKLKITYDSPLSLIDATAGEAFATLSMTEPGAYASPCNFMWDGQSISESQIKDGTILKLKFSIPENTVSGTYNVKVSFAQGEIIDNDLLPVSATVVNGYVDVVDYVPGDLNSDGNVDITDVIMYRRDMVGGYQQTVNAKAMDVNGDGIGSISDLILIRRYLVGGYGVELKPAAPSVPSTPSNPSVPPISTLPVPADHDFSVLPSAIVDINEYKQTIGILNADTNSVTTYQYTYDTTVTLVNGETVDFNSVLFGAFYDDYMDSDVAGIVAVKLDENTGCIKHLIVQKYNTDMVDEVDFSACKIYLKQGAAINLNTNAVAGLEYTITLNGEGIDIADVQAGDIITYRSANNKRFYEIFISRTTIEGTVDGVSKNSKGLVAYTINGRQYTASLAGIWAGLDNKLPSIPGAAGTFYLDIFGEIAYFRQGASADGARQYAYVIACGADTSVFGVSLKVKMFDDEGNIKIYDVADKLKVADILYCDGEWIEAMRNDGEAYDVYTGSAVNADVLDMFENLEGSLIAYTVNSNGELDGITLPGYGDYENDYDVFNFIGSFTGVYDEDNQEIGNKIYVTEDTRIFYVGNYIGEENFAIVDYTVFEDNGYYAVDAYVVNSYCAAKILVLRTPISYGNEKKHIALYEGYSTQKNTDDKTVSAITFYEGGKIKTAFCESKSAFFELPKSSVFEYEMNDKGEIKAITKIFGAIADQAAIAGLYSKVTSDAPTYVVGQVLGKNGTTLKLGDFESDNYQLHQIEDNTKVYMVERFDCAVVLKASDINAVGVNRFDSNGELYSAEVCDNYYVVIKYVNKVATDVVIYKNFFNN